MFSENGIPAIKRYRMILFKKIKRYCMDVVMILGLIYKLFEGPNLGMIMGHIQIEYDPIIRFEQSYMRKKFAILLKNGSGFESKE